jgi:hypothetical protein
MPFSSEIEETAITINRSERVKTRQNLILHDMTSGFALKVVMNPRMPQL